MYCNEEKNRTLHCEEQTQCDLQTRMPKSEDGETAQNVWKHIKKLNSPKLAMHFIVYTSPSWKNADLACC